MNLKLIATLLSANYTKKRCFLKNEHAKRASVWRQITDLNMNVEIQFASGTYFNKLIFHKQIRQVIFKYATQPL